LGTSVARGTEILSRLAQAPHTARNSESPEQPREPMTATSPMEKLGQALRRQTLVRIIEQFEAEHPDAHLKDLVIDAAGPGRAIVVNGRQVINFGSDSFLGLDQDPRLQEAVGRGLRRWGTHNGSSRAFASVRANVEAEQKLAEWLGVESVLILPSV